MSLAEDILGKKDLPSEKVNVPEWDMDLWVKTMTGSQRDAWEAAEVKGAGGTKAIKANGIDEAAYVGSRARLLVLTVCDESGALVFKRDQVDQLSEKSAGALSKLFNVAVRLNHISEDDIEDLEKN